MWVSGGPVTIGHGSRASDADATYLESNLGPDGVIDDRLLQVEPTPACLGLRS
jgi:hypothetical protein